MDVTVIVPWRSTDPARKASFEFVVERIACQIPIARHRLVQVVTADDPGETFNRGRAINAGVTGSRGDILVFMDADMILPDEAVTAGLEAIEAGAAMVVPFRRLVGLSGPASDLVIHGRSPFGPWGSDQVELEWDRPSSGGVNMIRRDTFKALCGFDERFAGWGGEDAAFTLAAETMIGPVEYVAAMGVHLWHPWSADRGTEQTTRNLNLVHRYEDAFGDREIMRRLIAGVA